MLLLQEQSPSGEQPESADAAGMSPEVRERLRCAADIRATLKAVGLDDSPLESSLKASSKKQKKSKKKLGGPAASERVQDAIKDQPHNNKKKKQGAELDQVSVALLFTKSMSCISQEALTLCLIPPTSFHIAASTDMGIDV